MSTRCFALVILTSECLIFFYLEQGGKEDILYTDRVEILFSKECNYFPKKKLTYAEKSVLIVIDDQIFNFSSSSQRQ